MANFFIGERSFIKGSKPFIIGEVGLNHNGDINRAFEMIKVAKSVGMDAVKFQTFRAAEFVGDPNQTVTYKSQGKSVTEPMLDMFQRCELNEDQWIKIKTKCNEEKIMFLSTPQNKSDLDVLMRVGVSAIKVGSDDFTNIPLLKEYAKTGLPMIISCGMSDMSEVYQALEATGFFEGYPVALLLCTSEYPTPNDHVNLLKLKSLSGAFENLILGFSDHTQGVLASSLAVAMGAVIFEKHFTLDHNLPGPDHWFSETPLTLREWCDSIKTSYQILGSSIVRPTAEERKMRILARRSVVAIRDIEIGAPLNEKNTGLRRPGNGMPPIMLADVIGKKANKIINKGSLIKWGDLE